MKYAFIEQHRSRYSLQSLRRVLHVSRSGYHDLLGRAPSSRTRSDDALLGHIRAVHRQHRQAYGAKKTWRYLNAINIPCRKHRVARLRKQANIEAQRKRRFRLTVEHHHTPKAAPDLLQRQFTTHAPNRIWVGDMTFAYPAGLAASGGAAGFVFTQGGGLVNGRACDNGIASIGTDNGN